MGSQTEQDEINVLVTGFGPFKEQYPVNPSWAIASSLPDYLPPFNPKALPHHSLPSLPPVRINVHPSPVHVAYKTVRPLVPKLWDEPADGRRVDIGLHIGMAGPKPVYQLERLAHRQGYKLKDVDGELLEDDGGAGHEDGSKWIWEGLPEHIETDVNVGGVMSRWRQLSPDGLDLKLSEDPGRYLCDFIYYSSLAHLTRKGERKRVVFLHVPADASETAIRTGRELVVQLIRALVESELSKRPS
ncbi:hypothetical protein DL546_008643 [Coniochaeta pulveracea]|uniref:Pyroglutamyl-peptidase 1 n=1 Tax=Coniochaeta pulveracea TaxID=177199 RepID=A0A420YFF3_9PEZI|nr:hypothetical protein DL546_008643 [Coniochaeta pulveracea]